MLDTSVPLCMRTARREFISALGAPSEEQAEKYRLRANRTMRKAIRAIGRDNDCDYDWTLLRPKRQED